MRRLLAGSSLVLVLLGSAVAGAGEAQPAPTVTVASSEDAGVTFDCSDEVVRTDPGNVVLERSGEPSGELTVTFEVDGSTVRAASATFAPGEATVSVSLPPDDDHEAPNVIFFALLDGDGYDVLQPGAAELQVVPTMPGCPPPPTPPEVEPDFTG